VRLHTGSCTEADREALRTWLEANPAHEVAFERHAAAWERTERLRALRPEGGIDPDLLHPRRRLLGLPSLPPLPWRMAAAVALCAGLGGAGLVWFGGSKAYATAVGERRLVRLGDGSRVELNTDTRLVIRLTPLGRKVRLERGEALFDVKPDKRRPFTVSADDDQVRALGTTFTVRLDDAAMKVVVLRGEVEVSGRSGPRSESFAVRLPAGSIGVYGPQGQVSRAAAAGETARSLSWRYGSISLSGETLQDAAEEFNRYNTKRLVVAAGPIRDIRLGGYFHQDDVEGFARAMHDSFGVSVVDTGAAIYLGPPARRREGAAAR
jgi:transmembrane sensor